MCLLTWPLNESEAGVDHVMIQTALPNDVVVMLISKNLHKKSSEISIKTRSTPASLSFIGQVTKHTTVKWTIAIFHLSQIRDKLFKRRIHKLKRVMKIPVTNQNRKGNVYISSSKLNPGAKSIYYSNYLHQFHLSCFNNLHQNARATLV